MKKTATLVLALSLGLSSQSYAREQNNIVPALIGAAIITSIINNSQPHYVQQQRYEYQYHQYPNQVYYAPQVPQNYYVPQPVYQQSPVIIYSQPPVHVNREYNHEHYRHHNYNNYRNHNQWNNDYRR